jgi:hypothetical protein
MTTWQPGQPLYRRPTGVTRPMIELLGNEDEPNGCSASTASWPEPLGAEDLDWGGWWE